MLGAGLLAGALYAVWRVLEERARTSPLEWQPQPFPALPRPTPRPEPDIGPSPDSTWVAPDGDRCPATHPVKAKLGSGIYHQPGGQMYDRTIPDRCYRDPAAAEADGLRASKR